MSNPIRIIIVEDNKAFAASLNKMLRISDNMSCLATYHSVEACIKALNEGSMPESDILLLDLHLPGENGLKLVPFLRESMPEMDIIVLTQNDDYLTTLEAIKLGVSGYILKSSSISDIRTAIWEVNEGGSVIDPQLSRLVLSSLSSEKHNGQSILSSRERQVLELLALGYVKKEVADKLDISYRTVAQYTESIYKKLQVPNVTAAVAAAIRKGLI